ncbi:hypothetical protein JCM15519_16920 [Fundidesulfovibrio butyratiphilus]
MAGEPKSWWKSKTLLVNGLSAIAVCVQALSGQPWFDPELQAALLSMVNVVLRIMTNQPVGR